MVIALTPVAWVLRGWEKLGRKPQKIAPSGSAAGLKPGAKQGAKKPARSATMIEGLPPRTMN
jgi:hypothetical protein